MSVTISDSESIFTSGITAILTKPKGYTIYPITYKNAKYTVNFEIVTPAFVNNRTARKIDFVEYVELTKIYAYIYRHREKPSIFFGRKGKFLYETDITTLTLNDQELDLRRMKLGDIKIHLPQIMSQIFHRYETSKQEAGEKEKTIKEAETWDGVVRED